MAVADFRALAERIASEILPDRLEKVWCEVINTRGPSSIKTAAALHHSGQTELARRMARVASNDALWEHEYNRKSFLAFKEVIPTGKLAFLTYTTPESELWWARYATEGAVLL